MQNRVVMQRTLGALLVSALAVTMSLAFTRAQGSEPNVVFSALQVIVQNDVFRPSPVNLLAGALGGLRKALSDAGLSGTLPDIAATNEATAKGRVSNPIRTSCDDGAGKS